MPNSRDELDRLLDSALVTYADPGPDAGLENRILSRIAAEASPSPRRRWLAWAIAVPVLAALLFFAVVSGTRKSHAPAPAPPQAHVTLSPSIPASQVSSSPLARPAPLRRVKNSSREQRRAKLTARSAPLPKLEMYPTPRPLSPQEEALVNFAARATTSEREALITAQRQNDAPLSVAAIEIKPLEAPALGAD